MVVKVHRFLGIGVPVVCILAFHLVLSLSGDIGVQVLLQILQSLELPFPVVAWERFVVTSKCAAAVRNFDVCTVLNV